MKQAYWISLVIWMISAPAYAEKIQLWTPNDGLSNSHISQIYQDSQGYIWIATENGLNKFDGYNFTVYSQQPNESTSLQGNYIYNVLEDSRGIFWVASMDGLLQYDRTKDNFHPFLIRDSVPFYLNRVTWVIEDKKGDIWVSYYGNGIIRLDGQTMEPTFYNRKNSPVADDNIDCAYEDSFGNLWLGTHENGVYLFNPEQQSAVHFQHHPGVTGSLSDNRVFSICEDSYGRIWIGTLGGGVNIYDRPSQTFRTLKPGPSEVESQIFSMAPDKKGNIWIGTDGAGIVRYDPFGKKLPAIDADFEVCDLKKVKVHYIFEDKQQNIWVGLYQKGILFIPSRGNTFRNYSFNPFNPQRSIGVYCAISVIEDSFGDVWIGTDGDGLYKVNTASQKIDHFSTTTFPSIPSNVITALFEDREKNVWVGSYVDGMFRYNRTTRKFDAHYHSTTPQALSHDHISAFIQDKDGILWIATDGGGLNSFDSAAQQIRHYKSEDSSVRESRLSNNWVYALHIDKNDRIWIGTARGVNRFDLKTKTFSNASLLNTLLDNKLIYTINEDLQENIWLGGFSGLYCINKQTGEITQRTTLNGLPDNMINGIEIDDEQNLWLSTGNGLCHYNPQSEQYLNFYAQDGIQSNEFRRGSHYRGKNNRMYFGGINGLTYFIPPALEQNHPLLYLAFTHLLIYNEQVQVDKSPVLEKTLDESETIHLKYNQRSFTFRFAAIEYSMPQRVLYYTQMENFDKYWRLVNNPDRNVTYTNLNPGKYIFKVKATVDGINFLEREVKVIIEPPFWLSIWAKIGYAIILLLIAYFIYWYLENRMKERRILMEKEQQKQLSESKLQFFTDISHEIRTPLTLILGPIEKLETEEKDEKTLSTYQIIHQNALRILRLVNQLMDLRAVDKGKLKLKVEPTSLQEFIGKIMDSFQELTLTKQIDFNLIIEDNLPDIYIDRDCLDKVIFNLLSNAFKFTNKGGGITLFTGIKNGQVEIRVEDTGIGIAKEYQMHIFDRFYQVRDSKVNTKMGTGIGLHLSKMMIELHHGEIFVESEPNQGCIFTIHLPLDENVYKPEEFGVTNGEATAMMVQPSFQTDDEGNVDNEKKENQSKSPAARSVLLVEDDVDILNYLDSELSSKYRIYRANNGKEGLSKALKFLPDIIVSDIVMPEMAGLTLCKLLKSNDKTCHIPIILLLVEDDVDILNYLDSELSSKYRIYRANNGKEGLSKALKFLPDIIVSDIVMPEMDGLTLCKLLKSNDKTCHIPIILLTAKTNVEQRIEGIEMGADSYIPKPFNLKHLETRIHKLIELRKKLKGKYSTGKDNESSIKVLSSDEKLLQKFNDKLRAQISSPDLSVESISKELGLSRVHLNRRLKIITNESPGNYIRNFRLKQAALLLTSKKMSIAEVAYAVGFSSHAYFSNIFKEHFGISPSEYADTNHPEEEIKT